ncbi:MAG: EAL domain-containing protein [Mycobacteriales bacterium]|nr:EAL domain-containing protein [Mycobacteriales bacterium]
MSPDSSAGPAFSRAARQVLAHLREQLDLEVAFVSRKVGDTWLLLQVDDDAFGLTEGLSIPWSDSLCSRVASGEAPTVAPDVSAVPVYATAAAHLGLSLGAIVSVPMRDDHGELLGTLCAGSPRARGPELAAQERHVSLLAALLGSLLSSEVGSLREDRRLLLSAAAPDPVTSALPRAVWDRALSAEEARCATYGLPCSLVVVDLAGLSEVNATLGHEAGDAVLRAAAQVLRDSSRAEDLLARISGDQLGLLLVECDRPQAEARVRQLRAALDAVGVRAAVGSATRRDDLMSAWHRADEKVRASKGDPAARLPLDGAAWEVPTHDDPVLSELLDLARRQVGADIAFLGAFTQGARVMRAISSEHPLPIGPGAVEDLDVTLCQRILDGRLPPVIPDTAAEPEAMALAITRALPIGSYVGVPVVLPGGRLYGTLCALSPMPDASLSQRDADALTAIAQSMARVLTHEETSRLARRSVLRRLDTALAGDATTMVFQPVLDLNGRVVGSEALARFQLEPVRGADQWFADAASVGLTVELELATARQALAALSRLPGWLALNFSATTLCTPALQAALADVDVSRLVLEVSEHEEIADYDALLRALAPLRLRGARVAVDDAGAGYASLRHVVRLEPEVLKLDISLVRGIDTAPNQLALATALTTFAHEIGSTVIAEGVETAAELATLSEVGVGLVQGWYLGRGVPLKEFLRRWSVPGPRARVRTSGLAVS